MATNLARLKGKGAPPKPEIAPDIMEADPRPAPRLAPRAAPKAAPRAVTAPEPAEPQRPIQVRVPESVFAEFSERAGREFGFTHGAKKQLFLRMWEAYKAQGTN